MGRFARSAGALSCCIALGALGLAPTASAVSGDGIEVMPLPSLSGETGLGALATQTTQDEREDLLEKCRTRTINGSIEAFRFAGKDRYETAVCASAGIWGSHVDPNVVEGIRANAVVLARGDNFPDALAGGPLAAYMRGPLLLNPPETLRDDVRAEIARVLPSGDRVYLLGGTSSLSKDIEDELVNAGYDVRRLAGPNRYETAIAIAHELPATSNFFFATGENFPDALAGGTAAAALSAVAVNDPTRRPFAVLLTRGDEMPDVTYDFALARGNQFGEWTLLTAGGWADRAVIDAFGAEAVAERFVGRNRYETATKIAETVFMNEWQQLEGHGVGLVTGRNYPDALAATPFLAHVWVLAPLLLSNPDTLSSETEEFLQINDGGATHIYVYGGATTLAADVVEDAMVAFK